jgi:hypothetical protein
MRKNNHGPLTISHFQGRFNDDARIAAQLNDFSEKVLHRWPDLCYTLGCAEVAQSVEQGTENPRVSGSIPLLGISFV